MCMTLTLGRDVVSYTMSPRPGPRRPAIAVRLSAAGLAHVDQLAKTSGVTRSEMIRRMLAYAATRMPKGWKP